MSKTIKPSEVHRDGSYNIPHLVAEANERLTQIGKYGSTAKLVIKKGTLQIQYSHPTRLGSNGKAKRMSVTNSWGGANTPINTRHLVEAESVATKITQALTSGTYSDEWKDELIGRKPKTRQQSTTTATTEQKLTFHDAWEVINNDWEGRKKKLKNPNATYYQGFSRFESWQNDDSEFTLKSLAHWLVTSKLNGKMKINHLAVIKRNLALFDVPQQITNWVEKEASLTEVSKQKTRLPDDKEIEETWQMLHEAKVANLARKYHTDKNARNLYLYGILAIYGLRIHEVFSIMNWDNPVIIRNGEFIAVNDDSDDDPTETIKYQGNDKIIPAINDPTNTEKILVIEKGKTGKRLALPFMPKGKNWFETFNLVDKTFNEIKPHYKNSSAKNKYGQNPSRNFCKWLKDQDVEFTAHKLRHACNIRMHQAGLNHLAIANSLGHTVAMNQSTYLRYQGQESKLEGLQSALNDLRGKQNEIDTLKTENERLKTENEQLKLEVQRLKLEKQYQN
ncbi:tyrosine-type recombinase/integrase [Oscillatoria salina]|uniref:tyrosine-type recombinase/integrase n=1 Tax=Oscillatoria salina TaxID=331517 RepID=UPI0013B70E0A|nr:tyrosine-type recombinase/integrase [Oscillatoria salina]MBZ8181256.1 tyrosine-type recombinase/integrase [Oscillatoria salina IIICB1]NET91591.1 tyrosine-type recombinase/integrase [Kamptonema sp. SIO1D9]